MCFLNLCINHEILTNTLPQSSLEKPRKSQHKEVRSVGGHRASPEWPGGGTGQGAGRAGRAGSAPEQQHAFGTRLPHQARVLQHVGLLAGVPALSPIDPVRQDGFLVEHLQAVGLLTATFVHCNDRKTPVRKSRAKYFPLPDLKTLIWKTTIQHEDVLPERHVQRVYRIDVRTAWVCWKVTPERQGETKNRRQLKNCPSAPLLFSHNNKGYSSGLFPESAWSLLCVPSSQNCLGFSREPSFPRPWQPGLVRQARCGQRALPVCGQQVDPHSFPGGHGRDCPWLPLTCTPSPI